MFEFQAQARLLQLSPVFEASQLQDDRMASGPALKDRASMIRPGAIDRCPLREQDSVIGGVLLSTGVRYAPRHRPAL